MSEKLSNNNSSSSIVDQSESLEKAENAETIRMERDELKKLIRMCVKEWCETTTSHGFGNIVRTDSWIIRTGWVILILAANGYCIYTLCGFISLYMEFKVNINYQVITDSPTDFPSVSICNLKPFDLTYSKENSDYLMNFLLEKNISPKLIVSSGEYAVDVLEEAASALKASVIADKSLNDSFLESLGFTLDTMLISCYYNNQRCNKSDFTWFRTFEYGNCYTFNGVFDQNNQKVKSKTTSKAGPHNGLVLELFVGKVGSVDYFTKKRGLYVIIHERSVYPLVNSDGFYAHPSTSTNIGITKTKYSKKEYPYSDCRKDVSTILPTDSDIFIKTKKLGKYYQKLCYEICLQEKYIIPNCGCSDPSIPITDPRQKICSNKITLNCVKIQKDKFETVKISDYCDIYCPLQCDEIVYSASVHSASFPTKFYSDILYTQDGVEDKLNPPYIFIPPDSNFTNLSVEKVLPISPSNSILNYSTTNFVGTSTSFATLTASKTTSNGIYLTTSATSPNSEIPDSSSSNSVYLQNSMVELSVFFSDLRYTYIEEQESISVDTFIGVIGGQFGLFMGASFLSFAELVEMVINIIRILNNFRKKRKTSQSTDNLQTS